MIHIVRKRRRRLFDVELKCDFCPCVSFMCLPASLDQLAGVVAAVRDGAALEGFAAVPMFALDGTPAGTGDVCANCRAKVRSHARRRWRR